MKSIYDWFFRDSMIFFSAKLDEGSSRLGKALSFLVASPIILFVGVLLLNLGVYIEDEWSQLLGESFCLLIAAGFFLICSWVTYRVIRVTFWLVDGFCKHEEQF